MWTSTCKKCGKKSEYNNRSNYRRALRGSGLCNGCARTGQKRTPEQCRIISEATIAAMRTPEVYEKFVASYTSENRKKRSDSAARQMKRQMTNPEQWQSFLNKSKIKRETWWKQANELTKAHILQKAHEGIKKLWSDNSYKEKISRNMTGTKNPFYGKKHPKDLMDRIRLKQSETLAKMISEGTFFNRSIRFQHGSYISKLSGIIEYYDSSYELIRMKQLDELHIPWTKKHKIRIKYIDTSNIPRYYVPDFLINNEIIEEVNPKNLVKSHFQNTDLKIKAGKQYCKHNHFTYRIITEKELGIKI